MREAKNVRLALRSADIEMYGLGKSIYNPSRKNNIEKGAKAKADVLYKPTGKYKITSYNSKKHELTGFVYEVGHYIVTYDKDGTNTSWTVDYRFRIYDYSNNDVDVDSDTEVE